MRDSEREESTLVRLRERVRRDYVSTIEIERVRREYVSKIERE